ATSSIVGCRCSKSTAPDAVTDVASDAVTDASPNAVSDADGGGGDKRLDASGSGKGGVAAASGALSARIAAAHLGGGDVVVAALDVAAKAIVVQRISPKDEVVRERRVLDGVAWSSDVELKLAAAGPGVALTWHGKRAGKVVRQLLVLGA